MFILKAEGGRASPKPQLPCPSLSTFRFNFRSVTKSLLLLILLLLLLLVALKLHCASYLSSTLHPFARRLGSARLGTHRAVQLGRPGLPSQNMPSGPTLIPARQTHPSVPAGYQGGTHLAHSLLPLSFRARRIMPTQHSRAPIQKAILRTLSHLERCALL